MSSISVSVSKTNGAGLGAKALNETLALCDYSNFDVYDFNDNSFISSGLGYTHVFHNMAASSYINNGYVADEHYKDTLYEIVTIPQNSNCYVKLHKRSTTYTYIHIDTFKEDYTAVTVPYNTQYSQIIVIQNNTHPVTIYSNRDTITYEVINL
jgi:hypothetical protein